MRIFDDGIMPVDFDKGAIFSSLKKAEKQGHREGLRGIMVAAALIVLFLAALALKYWLYLPGVRS